MIECFVSRLARGKIRGRKSKCQNSFEFLLFGDVSAPNCVLRSVAVAIVDKNLSHVIAAGRSFRVAVANNNRRAK